MIFQKVNFLLDLFLVPSWRQQLPTLLHFYHNKMLQGVTKNVIKYLSRSLSSSWLYLKIQIIIKWLLPREMANLTPVVSAAVMVVKWLERLYLEPEDPGSNLNVVFEGSFLRRLTEKEFFFHTFFPVQLVWFYRYTVPYFFLLNLRPVIRISHYK